MKRTVDVLKEDFMARQRRPFKVSWTDELFYFDPVTAEDWEKVQVNDPGRQEQKILLLIRKAKRADGTPHFEAGDLFYLKTQADNERINELVDGLLSGIPSPEQARAAVTADPPSGSGSDSPQS
jgi:hypothetical protein